MQKKHILLITWTNLILQDSYSNSNKPHLHLCVSLFFHQEQEYEQDYRLIKTEQFKTGQRPGDFFLGLMSLCQ